MATMKNKPVSFNIENPEELELLNYVESVGKFSGYMKELIRKDIEAKKKKPDVVRTQSGVLQIKID